MNSEGPCANSHMELQQDLLPMGTQDPETRLPKDPLRPEAKMRHLTQGAK